MAQELLYFYKKGVNTLDFGPKNPGYLDALQIADSLLADIGLPSFTIVHSLPAGKYRRDGSEREVLMLNDMLADGSGLDGSVQGLSMLNDKLEGCSGLEGSLQETSMLNVMQEGCSGRVSPVHGIFPPDSTSQPSSRRQFFHHAFRETTKIAAKTLTPSKWRFNHSEFNMARMFTEVSLYEVDLDRSSCTLCEACFKLCKQRIFTIKGDTLEICHAKCNGCGLCADVCDSKAVRIRLKAHRVLREELPLNQDVCTECGSAYPGWPENRKADSTCPPCESRKQFGYLNPFCT